MKTGTVVWMAALLWISFACDARQVIHACRDATDTLVYQDARCAPATHEVAVYTYVTPRDPPDAERKLAAIDRQLHAQWEHERWTGAGTVRRRSGPFERENSDTRERDRRRCHAARAAVTRAMRSRTFRGDREALEEAAVDSCFGL